MENRRPLILISNDDGYLSPGIKLLTDVAATIGDVIVVAPDGARSGYSCAFSATDYLRLTHRETRDNVDVWSCNGTPVDCVKLAFARFFTERTPDIILSGVNHGDNSSVNNHYSGTMGVAMEGCLKRIPSVAFSSCYYDEHADLSPLRPYIRDMVCKVLAEGLPQGVCLNVNFPARNHFEGVKICRMTLGSWINEIATALHPRGHEYYWVVGEYRNDEPEAEDTDQWALAHGYVSVTPTRMDVTAYEAMEQLRGWQK